MGCCSFDRAPSRSLQAGAHATESSCGGTATSLDMGLELVMQGAPRRADGAGSEQASSSSCIPDPPGEQHFKSSHARGMNSSCDRYRTPELTGEVTRMVLVSEPIQETARFLTCIRPE
jgi:hypothetical protein